MCELDLENAIVIVRCLTEAVVGIQKFVLHMSSSVCQFQRVRIPDNSYLTVHALIYSPVHDREGSCNASLG